MKAAVVSSFEHPPRYEDFPPPVAGDDEVRIAVRAAGLSQLVKGQAAGRHYSSGVRFPFVPGADGVGRLPDGRRVYFAFPRAPHGTMATECAVRSSLCVPVPDAVDDVTAAAIANPGMSSWVALTVRAGLKAGESVLIHGATGASGRLAIQIARHLGAGRVVVTARREAGLAPLMALGADAGIALEQPPEALASAFREETARGVAVVLDYLWGATAGHLIHAFVNRGPARVRYVQIGSLAGGEVSIPAAALRSSGLELLGSGLGSIPLERLVHAAGEVLRAVVPAKLGIDAVPVPLADVESAWSREGARIVFTMRG